ncbi:ribonuclease H-like domain-containing protein [Tanacetum coccineum]
MIKDLGKLKYFMGIEVLETPNGICLSKRKYCLELIDEFGILASKPSYIPIQPNISLSSESKDDDPLLKNINDYQKLIGKLIYLTTTRTDIAYTVSCLSQFMHCPLKSHLKITLKITRYLKSSPGKGINVIKQFTSSIVLKAYSNADWERCTNTRSHLKTALKIIKYLKSSPGKGINVIKQSASGIVLKAYSNADWERCTNTRRFVTG